MFSDLGPEEIQQLITIFLLLIPATFYGLGLMEGKWARPFFLTGIVAHLFNILYRAYTVGGIPLAEKFDNISFMAFSTALAYWHYSRGKDIKDLQLMVLPLASVLLLCAFFYMPINTVSPFLRTPWFYLHMFLFFLSYGFFGVSACIGVAYVLSGDVEHEALQYRTASYGWTIYTISLVVGSIWFFIAYGMYWLWTSRELFTTLAWFYFGLYLHQRYIKGLSGRTAAIVGVIGYLVALFAYFGLGTVIPAPPVQF